MKFQGVSTMVSLRKNTLLFSTLMLLVNITFVDAVLAAREDTKVGFTVQETRRDGRYKYRVKIKETENCKAGRAVTVYHDVDNDKRLGVPPDFIIREGVTNERGKFTFRTRTVPDDGDRLGVIVDRNKNCKKGRKSIIFDE